MPSGSRRAAWRARSLSQEQALRLTLERAAAGGSLAQLLAQRNAERAAAQARVTARRAAQFGARAAKAARKLAPAGAWQAWFDGSAHPNPGHCGIGAVLKGPNGEHIELCQDAGYGTSSEAEYRALLALLDAALALRPSCLWVRGDSLVVVDDVNGPEHTAAPALRALRARARELVAKLGDVTLLWIPRRDNSEADALSQRAVTLRTDSR